MSITNFTDYNDSEATLMGDYLTGMYYYYLDKDLILEKQDNYKCLPFTGGAIKSISYNPFLNKDDLKLLKVKYDINRFGTSKRFKTDSPPYLYRILENESINKTIMTCDVRYPDDEPILGNFPFRYFGIYDGYNEPLLIKPNLLDTETMEVRARTGVNMTSKYCIYVYKYKGDKTGELYGMINNNPMLTPVTSDIYSQWWASSSSSFLEANNITRLQNSVNYKQADENNFFDSMFNILGGFASGVTGNVGGGLFQIGKGTVGGLLQGNHIKQNYEVNEYANETMKNATVRDYEKTPRGVVSMGNDFLFNQQICGSCIYVNEYNISSYHKDKARKYLQRYGYKVNDYLSNINLRSRNSWNFIKMTTCNIQSSSVPREHLEEIKAIYEKGCTMWHVDRGVQVKNYSQNNSEV